ncbi:MAG: acyl-CoA dehydrogenase family protein [Acidimicrobiales bacterium]
MDLRLSPEQDQLVDAFVGLYAKHSSPEHVRAAEAIGFDPELWKRLADLGAVPMAVGEADGGWGASFLDLALMAEQQGRFVAAVPVVEAQVAARLLAGLGEAAAGPLADALGGERLITFAPRAARGDVAGLVPAGSVADDAVVLAGDRLLLVPLDGARTTVENLASMPLADVVVPASAIVLAEGDAARSAHDRAVDEWMALTGAALVGVAARALEIGVEYVKERKAWGVPIGSFQGIAHRLADSATAVDGARLLAYEAAWAVDDQPERAAELAAMAFPFAYEAARDATYRSLHFHGGYGFMMEYDIQLYYRRARGWANVYDDPELVYRRVADRRYGPPTSTSTLGSEA